MAGSRREDKPDGIDGSERLDDGSERVNGRREDIPALDEAALDEGGILGALPHTRPQRATPRRAAAQAKKAESGTRQKRAGTRTKPKPQAKRTSAKRSAQPAPAASTRAPTSTPARTPARGKAPARTAQPRAPRQGYEPEEELELGKTVHPPSGVEMVESVADIFVELASAGLKAGGRALKDVLSPLRRP